jgi:hypothetical protein
VRRISGGTHIRPSPTYDERFEVVCDASLVGIGEILLQNDKPIVFES